MSFEEINYRTLRKIQQLEKNSPVLTELYPGFYNDLSDYQKELNKRLKKEIASQKKIILNDEISTTKKIAINIYEYREKKIMLAAITKARGGNPDIINMLESEKELFDFVFKALNKWREKIVENKNIENDYINTKNDEEEKNNEKFEKINKKGNNIIVRVNQSLPEFIGIDTKKYNLRVGDILSLSKEMSEMLIKKEAVKKLEL